MAGVIEKMVKLIFEGDDRVSKVMSSIEGNVSKFSSSVESATEPLANIAEKALMAETALAAMVTGGIVYATNEAGKFGDSFNEISTLIDAPAEALADFKDDVLSYSRDSSSAMETITGATYNIISATGDWENSLERLSAAERLNIAGKGELNDTAKLLATSMNAYGAASGDASDYADVLFKTVKVGVTNLTELSASLGTVTGLASSAGVPFDDLSSAVGALTGTVGDTSLAVTQVKSILTAVVKPSEQAKKAADDLGISFDTQSLKAMGLEKFLKMVYDATDGNSEVMARLFGRVEGLNGALVLGADSSGKYADALRQMEERAGAVDEAYEIMANNMRLVNQNLVNNIQATVIQFGSNFLDEWRGIAGGVSDIFQGISIAMDEGSFDPVITFIEQIGQDLENYIRKIAEALPEALADVDFDNLLSSVQKLGGSVRDLFESFFGDIDLTTPEGLAKAIQKIVDSGEALTRVTAGIVEGLEPFVAGLGRAVDGVNNLDGPTQNIIGNVLGFATGLNKVVSALNMIGPAISVLAVTQIPQAIAITGSFIASLGSLQTILAGGAAYGIGYFAGKLINDYVPGVAEGAQEIFRLADTVLNFTGTQGKANEMLEESGKALDEARIKFKEYQETLKNDQVTVDDFDPVNLDELKEKLAESGALVLQPEIDTSGIKGEDLGWTDAEGNYHPFTTSAFQYDIAVSTKINETEDTEKIIKKLSEDTDAQLKLVEIAAETAQTKFEWQAKLDIAQVEAGVRRVEASFSSIQAEIASTGGLLESLFSGLNNASSRNARSLIERQIREEIEMRAEAHDKNMALLDVQLKLEQERLKRSQSGQSLYTIEAANLQPHLEAIWVEVVNAIQIRADEEGLESLIGI